MSILGRQMAPKIWAQLVLTTLWEGPLDKTVVPKQVIVMAPKSRGAPLDLPFGTSLLIYASKELPPEREVVKRLQVMSLPYALCKVSPTFFQLCPLEGEIALRSIESSDELLRVIVRHHFVRAAGRLVGAYRFLKDEAMVDELLKGINAVNMRMQETNHFVCETPLLLGALNPSPYAARITAMWHQYRSEVIQYFPEPPGLPTDPHKYFEEIDEQYIQDAYHSLSIEGYQVTPELIEKVKQAMWRPESNEEDRKQHNALAARGYYEAFLAVKRSLEKILRGGLPGEVVASDLAEWYRSLFNPNVAVGLIDPSDLFGYRRHQVYIRNSRHTPLPVHGLRDAMEALFNCLKGEEHPGVRAVLGHFLFVFIHPYMDGNGRMGRLLMNTMLGSGGTRGPLYT